jgi:hypothetical protein
MSIGKEAAGGFGAPEILPDAPCPGVGVTVCARMGDFYATPPGIERVVRPLDFRVLSHDFLAVRGVAGPYEPNRTICESGKISFA